MSEENFDDGLEDCLVIKRKTLIEIRNALGQSILRNKSVVDAVKTNAEQAFVDEDKDVLKAIEKDLPSWVTTLTKGMLEVVEKC